MTSVDCHSFNLAQAYKAEPLSFEMLASACILLLWVVFFEEKVKKTEWKWLRILVRIS